MNAEIVYTKIVYQVITALAFGGLLLYQIKNKRKHNIRFDQTIFIYLIWLIASLLGVVYINSELVNFGRGVPNVWSVFIAVFLFYLYVWPINYLSERNTYNGSGAEVRG